MVANGTAIPAGITVVSEYFDFTKITSFESYNVHLWFIHVCLLMTRIYLCNACEEHGAVNWHAHSPPNQYSNTMHVSCCHNNIVLIYCIIIITVKLYCFWLYILMSMN